MDIITPRLVLEPWSPVSILALIETPELFAEVQGAPAADGLRDMFVSGDASPEWLASLRQSDHPDPWLYGYAVFDPRAGEIVATCGFKRMDSVDDVVEIAYGVAPGYQGRGYATELADGLVRFAFDDPAVHLVIAHTLAQPNASTRVLAKCGFERTAEIVDPDDGPVWRWERPRRD